MTALLATLSGASGSGKSSYCREVMRREPAVRLVASLTTRAPRSGDLPGEYRCLSGPDFDRLAPGDLLWSIGIHGHRYATARRALEEALDGTDPSIMLIAPDRVAALREIVAGERGGCGRLRHFFCCAPDDAELRRRLERRRGRGDAVDETETARRIEECAGWEAEARMSGVPYVFLPGCLSIAVAADRIIGALRDG